MSWVPNIITLGRLLMVPVVAVLLATGLYTQAFWLFLAVGLSDGLDGFIARRFNATSIAGALLDPVAAPLIVRDALMLSVGFTDPSLKDGWLPPNRVGKTHAALAFSTLTLAIAQAAGLFDLGWFLTLLYWLLFVTVWLSAALYYVAWRRGHRDAASDTSAA